MTSGQEDKARGRFIAINAIRLSGAVLVILGLLIHEGALALPPVLGWIFLALGLIDVFVIPQVLARRWRTPPE